MAISVQLTIENPTLIAGVEHARDLYNATLPEDTKPLTSEDYIMFIAKSAVVSYARQKIEADFDAGDMTKKDKDAALTALAAI